MLWGTEVTDRKMGKSLRFRIKGVLQAQGALGFLNLRREILRPCCHMVEAARTISASCKVMSSRNGASPENSSRIEDPCSMQTGDKKHNACGQRSRFHVVGRSYIVDKRIDSGREMRDYCARCLVLVSVG